MKLTNLAQVPMIMANAMKKVAIAAIGLEIFHDAEEATCRTQSELLPAGEASPVSPYLLAAPVLSGVKLEEPALSMGILGRGDKLFGAFGSIFS